MKIRQLHINRFGHFNEYDLTFHGDGLQVVYGPNEAGKTTLLEFVRGLLFDFPARSPYDFGGQGEMAGVATLELRDGRTVELRRRKGNKDKVAIKLDGHPTGMDGTGWLRLLDHADRGLFESVFAFGLDQLSEGEASLAHESVQSALFGGSLGGSTTPDKVISDLSRQADELFKKGGSKPAINAHLAEIKRLTKEIKDRSLRPARYHEAEAAEAAAVMHAQGLHIEVDRLRREHSRMEKQVRAWPKWWELQKWRSERAGLRSEGGLEVAKNIPADARQCYQAVRQELESLEVERSKQADAIRQAENGLAELTLDPQAIAHRVQIKSCLELRRSFIEAKEQLPERRWKREEMRQQIDRELNELRPGWGHGDLRAFCVDVAARSQIERLSDEHGQRANARTTLTAKQDVDANSLNLAREELAEIGAPRDVATLDAALADEADYAGCRKQLESLSGELAKLERKLAAQCRKLTPPVVAATPSPQDLPVPRIETVTEFQVGFTRLSQELRTARASAAEDEAEYRELEKSLATAISNHAVPLLDQRDAARARRDAGWRLVLQKYILSQPTDSAIEAWLETGFSMSLPDAYEHAVSQADEVADRIYDNASEVAERESLRRQLGTLATRLDQKRQRIGELDQHHAELQSQWRALWHSTGFEPLSADAMLAWLNDHQAACTTIGQRDELLAERLKVDIRCSLFEQNLRAACGVVEGDVSALLVWARQAANEAKERQRRATELQKDVRRLEKQLAKYDTELQDLATRADGAHAEWQTLLSRLKLPTEWDIELAREVIDKLSATRVRLDGLPGEDARITAMQARIEEFDQRVRSLCEAIAPELLRDPSELAVKKLDEQVERAVSVQQKHVALSQKCTAARAELESLSERQRQHEAAQARWFAQAGATTEAEFIEVVSRAERIVELDSCIGQLAHEVDLIRASEDREQFENSLSTCDLVVLQGQERDLCDQLKKCEQMRSDADGAAALARGALEQLDGSDEVAIITEQLSRKRSLLAAEVDRYMPLVYARHLLNASVKRFEKENQPAMIADVSRLLSQMTGGKYVEFDRTGGGKQNIVVRRADGVERTPDQLSTGTREQLYLAIRLAYVLHYCQGNQPLPIVIDDVLVNFDDVRARKTLAALAIVAASAQVLFFTCHAHMLSIAREVVPELVPIELPSALEVVRGS